MKIPEKINWNGFLETIIDQSRSKQESCAWIFANIKDDIWEILEVKNIGLKGRSIRDTFAPDKKDFAEVKRKARKLRLTRIGNVHTHVVIGNDKNEMEYQFRPSEPDLQYAKKFNDVIRAVIVVNFTDEKRFGKIYGIIWFDQYGKILKKEKYY